MVVVKVDLLVVLFGQFDRAVIVAAWMLNLSSLHRIKSCCTNELANIISVATTCNTTA
jgi:hypothetical protein